VDCGANASPGPVEPAITPELLADLQAGLLDDATAARLRRRARADPAVAGQLAALDRLRRDLCSLGTDAASAPEVPAEVTGRVEAALRSAHQVTGPPPERPTHAARRARPRMRVVVAAAGVVAAIAAVGVGTAALVRPTTPAPQTGPTVQRITVPDPPNGFPLTQPQLVGLLHTPPDFGPLDDPQHRAWCLTGLGYRTASAVLGATSITVRGQPSVILLMPGDAPGAVDVVAVRPNCSSVDTGLLASTTLRRP
jgi:hypothetical protein